MTVILLMLAVSVVFGLRCNLGEHLDPPEHVLTSNSAVLHGKQDKSALRPKECERNVKFCLTISRPGRRLGTRAAEGQTFLWVLV